MPSISNGIVYINWLTQDRLFRLVRNISLKDNYNNISKYSRGQYETALSTATQNQITSLRDSAVRSDNMADQMKTISLMGDLYRSTGKELGLDDEQINEKIRANTDQTGKQLLDRAVAEN